MLCCRKHFSLDKLKRHPHFCKSDLLSCFIYGWNQWFFKATQRETCNRILPPVAYQIRCAFMLGLNTVADKSARPTVVFFMPFYLSEQHQWACSWPQGGAEKVTCLKFLYVVYDYILIDKSTWGSLLARCHSYWILLQLEDAAEFLVCETLLYSNKSAQQQWPRWSAHSLVHRHH